MKLQTRISCLWQSPEATQNYLSGVSLHSHTNQSHESLTFLHKMATEFRVLRPVFAHYERTSAEQYGVKLDFLSGHWTPPLTPRMAFDLEHGQIEQQGLMPLVSITDHDNINAPMLLRTVPSARHIPVSLEWSAPFEETEFHIGVHNLPSATATSWMNRLAEYSDHASAGKLTEVLRDLHAEPNVLVVANHPLWDLHQIGQEKHNAGVREFLARHNEVIHAIELNGLRHWRENRDAVRLANEWGQVVISGGDRHGLEPNANINLSNAASFTSFVHEVRYEKKSHVLFMPQYAGNWQQRILRSTLEAVSNFPHFPAGMQRWDERVFHPDQHGMMRRASELWPRGKAPKLLAAAIGLVHMLHHPPVASGLRLALGGFRPAEISEQELA